MRLLICLMLIAIGLSAEAASPSISCAYSRTSGTAPLGVIVDLSGTTDADTSKPFHDLLYRHTFGDPNAGTWSYGAAVGSSKNVATGPIAAHVYETAGTYTITSTVTDGTNIAQCAQSITVSEPDTTYSGTATVCFFNSTVGTGCPSGATQTSSSDWDAAMGSCAGATKRCLFKRGDTFTASASANWTSNGPGLVGAYGSGADPIVTMANFPGLQFGGTVSDVRVMDINFQGNAGTNQTAVKSSGATPANITVLRVTGDNTAGVVVSSSSGLVIQDSTFTNADLSAEVVFLTCNTLCAVLGNAIGPATNAFQAFRHSTWQRSVIANNTITGSPAQRGSVEAVAIRAAVHSTNADDSFYNVFADNKLVNGTIHFATLQMSFTGSDVRIYDYIFERNWFVASATSTVFPVITAGQRVTWRNNIVDVSALTGVDQQTLLMYVRAGSGGAPVTDDANLYNNTLYSGSVSSTTMRGITIENSGVTNSIVKNNLCWLDLGAATNACVNDSGTGTVQATNSTNAQTTGTDPSFDGPTSAPIGFRIGTGSYAATGGTDLYPSSESDFFDCNNSVTADVHIGAFVPRVRAMCRAGAGP